jgi:hypothetical protein
LKDLNVILITPVTLPHSNLMEITYKSPWQIIAAELRPLWLLWTLYIFTQHPTNLGKSILTENSTKSLLDSSMRMKGKGILQCVYSSYLGLDLVFIQFQTEF